MGKLKKGGVNEKAVDARAAKETAKSSKKEKEAKEREDAEWRAAGEGKLTKAQQEKERKAAAAADAAKKKAEAKALAAAEEAELSKIGKKKPVAKVTNYQLQKQRESDAKARASTAEEDAAAKKRVVSEDAYAALVETENVNRVTEGEEARSVTDAISLLGIAGGKSLDVDAHPERRQKAAHAAFEEQEIARLRQEKPGLRTSQYKEMAWKSWLKAPSNPNNQAALAAKSSSGA